MCVIQPTTYTPIDWTVWRRQSAVNMISCENSANIAIKRASNVPRFMYTCTHRTVSHEVAANHIHCWLFTSNCPGDGMEEGRGSHVFVFTFISRVRQDALSKSKPPPLCCWFPRSTFPLLIMDTISCHKWDIDGLGWDYFPNTYLLTLCT